MLQRADGALLPFGGTGDAARAEAFPFSTGVDDLGRFFELSVDLLCLAGFDGYFQRLSPSWSDLLGFTLDELTAVPFDDFVHPDDRDRTASLFAEQVVRGIKGIRFENRYRHRDGSYRSLSWNATPDAERGLVYAVARWIDPQIDAERAVRESEERFRSAFDDALVGMCMASPDGRFQRVNSTFAKMLGRPASELVGMFFSDVTHPDDLSRSSSKMKEVLEGRAAGFHDEKRYLRPDGVQVTALLSTTLVRDPKGEPSHFVTQLLDVTQDRAAAATSAATATMLDGIVQNSQSLVYVKDLDGKYLLANKPFLEAFNVSEQDLLGRDDTWLDPTLEPVWRVNDRRARDGAYRLQEWSGHGEDKHWYESVKFPLYDGSGELYATCGVSLDVSELHRQREEANRAGAFSAAVLAASPDAIVVDELEGGTSVYASKTAAELVGTTEDGANIGLLASAAHTEDRHRLTEALRAATGLDDGQVLQVRYRSSDPVGGPRWLSRRITPFRRGDDGRLVEVLSVVRDVSEIIAAEDRLTHAALHDPLTGLPNRTLLTDRLTGALFRARRHHQEVAVLFCDLDGFKRVNDGAGHAVGDEVLVQTGLRLRDCLRAQDTVARVGGDEFVIIVEPLNYDNDSGPMPTPRQLGEQVAKRIVAALGRPVDIDGTKHTVTVSVGLAFAGGDGETEVTAENVLRDADAAMYRAKSRGKDCYEVCDSDLQTHLTERTRVETVLRRTLAPTGQSVEGQHAGWLDVA